MVGTPRVDGAMVVAEVLEHGRDAKIRVFKYKSKTRYRRRHGHRQDFTRLAIRDILIDGEPSRKSAEQKPKRSTRRISSSRAEATPAEAAAPATPAAAAEPAAPAPRRSRKAPPKSGAQASKTPARRAGSKAKPAPEPAAQAGPEE